MHSKQYKYLDLLKVIAIFFVCMYHFWYGSRQEFFGMAAFVRKYLYSILSTCVPLFFAVNGALLLNKETFDARRHFQKLLVIVVRYFLWRGITCVVLGIQEGVDFFALNKHQLLNIFLFLETPEGVDLNHFWFIPTLCGIYILYPFVRMAFEQEQQNRNARISVLCLLGIAYVLCFLLQDVSLFKDATPYLMYFNVEPLGSFNPFGSRIGTMLTYFMLGGFFHRYHKKTGKIPTTLCVLMILAGLLLSYGIVVIRNFDYDIVFGGYSTTGTLLCTTGIFLLASRMEEKIPEKGMFRCLIRSVGRNTMTIYYSHWILGYILLAALSFGYGCFWNLLKAALFIACGTLLGEGIKRIPVVKYLIH